ncbi:MAG TPA: hypothetical protein VLK65_05685 [Vicinamibacteria bacterium]|nr:hypothetical protein [Vicinamibacteria bacterium]
MASSSELAGQPQKTPGNLKLREVDALHSFRGIPYPARVEFRQLLVTGPPGSGKTTQVQAIGGWPEEGYLDLTLPSWWRSRVLAFRPREVHFGLPFKGCSQGLTLFEDAWMRATERLQLQLERICLPPADAWWRLLKWRSRYAFEFLLPSAATLFSRLQERAKLQSHPIDSELTLERLREQRSIHVAVARLFHHSGLVVFVREALDGMPKWIDEDVVAGLAPWESAPPHALEERLARRWEKLGGRETLPVVEPTEPIRLAGSRLGIPHKALPVELRSGQQRLEVQPEVFLHVDGHRASGSVLVFDPEDYEKRIYGFVRLDTEGRTRIGSGQEDRFVTSRLPRERTSRLEIANDGKLLKVTDLESPSGTEVIPLRSPDRSDRLVRDRLRSLSRIRDLYGGPIRVLDTREVLDSLSKLADSMENDPWRPQDRRGKAGGILEVPAGIVPILVGDLHATIDNFLTILSQNKFLEELERGKAVMILLGDAIHSDDDRRLENMESSLLMTDLISKLMLALPGRLHYVRGTHESFSYELSKGGVPQGQVWKRQVLERRGEAYFEVLQRFYERLPYVVRGVDFAACHAGPPIEHVSRRELVDITRYPRLRHQITWNRLRTLNNPTGYSKGDVAAFKKALGLPRTAPLIVAHSPRQDGGTVWMDLGGIKAHHLIFSGGSSEVAVFTRIGGEMTPLVYPSEPLMAWPGMSSLSRGK